MIRRPLRFQFCTNLLVDKGFVSMSSCWLEEGIKLGFYGTIFCFFSYIMMLNVKMLCLCMYNWVFDIIHAQTKHFNIISDGLSLQSTIALSTTKVEYRVLSEAARNVSYL